MNIILVIFSAAKVLRKKELGDNNSEYFARTQFF